MTRLPARSLVAVLFAGLLVRSLLAGEIFRFGADGSLDILLHRADSSYHARRALYSAENFPAALLFDRYIAHPDGAVVPMPPFYDWALGGAARLLGGGLRRTEWVAALVSPLLGALAALPVARLGALLGGPRAGLLAAWLCALLPISAQWQRIGDADHHAAVAFLGAWYLALAAQLASAGSSRARALALAAGLFAARTALATSWSGSLLYLGVIEASLAVSLLAIGARRGLAANAAGLALSAAVAAAVVAACPTPQAGPFSTTTLSWLHVVALGAGAGASLSVALALRWPGLAGPVARWPLALAAAAAPAGAALLLFPDLWEGLRPAAAFLAGEDSWAGRNPEQFPLLGFLPVPGFERPLVGIGHQFYGGFLYLIPLVPVAGLLRARDPARRGAALCFAIASGCLGALAVLQLRFGNEFAASASVGFALCLDSCRRRIAPRAGERAAGRACALAAALLLLPGLALAYAAPARSALAALGIRALAPAPVAHDVAGHALIRFARRVRALTPETSGYFDSRLRPEYAVLCNPGHGGVVVYAARRPVASSNFGPYLDLEKYQLAREFFELATSEARAVAIAQRLDARYVLSFDYGLLAPPLFAHQLHRLDGSGRGGARALQHFRLIAESEPGDLPLWHDFPEEQRSHRVVPYKLFERVAGARLAVETAPAAKLSLRLPLRTASGRDFVYRQTASADAAGRAELVLPYSSRRDDGGLGRTRAEGPYRIEAEGRSAEFELSDAEVLGGARRALSLR